VSKRNSAIDRGTVRPDYGGGSFADIPAYIQQVLTGAPQTTLQPAGWPGHLRCRRIVTIFIDAFGWRFFERFQDHPLLQRFANAGSVTKLTSQFPSTTSAHVTTLYTGLPVGQHGVYEWFYYEPQVDRMIAPLLFSYAGDSDRESLQQAGVAGAAILPKGRVSRMLAAHGVRSYLVQPREFFNSTYSAQMGDSARMIPYLTLPEGLATITQTLRNVTDPAWVVGYFGTFDAVCHLYGPDAAQSDADLDATLTIIERWLTRDLLGKFDDTLLMIIADHGQIETEPERTLYLDQTPAFNKLRPLLRTNQRGELLAPAGSCRDFFVHAQEAHLDEAQAVLTSIVRERAEVRRVDTMIEQGYFGPTGVSAQFRSRVGNLVVLPFAGESVYWLGDGRFKQKYHGHHGGLTPQEMEIPLLLLPL
jgi:predicted AlkP superfamily pyrophosphatase or phosphodiesterase